MRRQKVLDKKFFLKIGMNVVARYREHIFSPKTGGRGARDIDGDHYPDYADGGKLKRTGKGRRQSAKFKNSKAPVFSGDLMRDFQLRNTKANGFTFGTISEGGKVKSLRKKDRVISKASKALPDSVENYIIEEAEKYTKKTLGKLFPKRKVINI